jgi:hypothetical protein
MAAGVPDQRALRHAASALIRQLFEKKVTRQFIVESIAATPESYREFFKARLNFWREKRA